MGQKRHGPTIAVVGSGYWGMNHVRTWNDLGHLRVVCDVDEGRLAEVRDRYPDLETSTSLESVLRRDDIDGVVLATPAATHASLAKEVVRAGKDVLVEKPMALTVAQAREVVEEARAADRIVMVGHVLEYHPAVEKLTELIAEGAIGRAQYLYSHRLNFGRVRTEEDALWSFAPHDIAIMLRLVGAMPERVSTHGGGYIDQRVADVTTTDLTFPGNVRAHIFVSWLHPFKEHRFVVVGDEQMAVFDDTQPWESKLVLYPHRVKWVGGQVPVADRAEATPVPLEAAEPLRRECEAFAEAIATRVPARSDGASGVRVLSVLEAASRSLEDGTPAPVDAAPSGPESAYVHPTATVDPGAHLEEDTYVWHYSHVMDGASVGAGSILGQNVFVASKVAIGRGVKVQNNVSVYEGVVLEDHVFCGPSVVFTNVMNPRSEVERKSEFRQTLVKRGATLGANSTIVCGVSIGRYAFVGAGAVVTMDVPDNALVVGVPARVIGWMCDCGGRVDMSGAEGTCELCGKRYLVDEQGLHQQTR